MKVFISWSGERSRRVSSVVKAWLGDVLQNVEVWVSSTDISAGERWSDEVNRELQSAKFGILVLTRTNVDARWILFEAGALAKSFPHGRLVPLLVDLTATDVKPPLSQFQAVRADREGVWKLVESVNGAACNDGVGGVDAQRLERLFNRMWQHFESDFEEIIQETEMPTGTQSVSQTRPDRDILEEMLSLVRNLVDQNRHSSIDHWTKRYTTSGHFMEIKQDGTEFKGVRTERPESD